MAACTEITVTGTTEKRYGCIDRTCTEQAGGAYTEPTCAGACTPSGGSDTTLLILGAAAIGALILFGGKKGEQ